MIINDINLGILIFHDSVKTCFLSGPSNSKLDILSKYVFQFCF